MTTATATRAAGTTTGTQDLAALLGRALVALLFVPAGWAKIAGFAGITGYIASKGVPLPQVAAAIAIAAELGLGLAILFGWRTRLAALGLAVFTAVITPIFHAYWTFPEAQQMVQQQAFFKNLAIVGGLLVLAAFGAGRLALDARMGPR